MSGGGGSAMGGRQGGGSSGIKRWREDEVEPKYRAAAFQPSKQLPASSLPNVRLIKVPKSVATSWRAEANKQVVGTLKTDPKSGEEFLALKESQGGASETGKPGQRLKLLKVCPVQHNRLYILQLSSNSSQADVLCDVPGPCSLIPTLDWNYHSVLRTRHMAANVERTRYLVEETRRHIDLDGSQTLFQYFNPRREGADDVLNDDSKRATFDAPASRGRAKQRKVVTMDPDQLKMRIFQMFEASGEEGLQLKQLAMQTDQPLNYVKSVVEEVAEQRKRPGDRKVVYYLKDHYNPFSVVGNEVPVAKKAHAGDSSQ